MGGPYSCWPTCARRLLRRVSGESGESAVRVARMETLLAWLGVLVYLVAVWIGCVLVIAWWLPS